MGAVKEMAPSITESVVARYIDAEEICPLVKMCPPVYERLNAEDYIREVIKDKPADSEWPEVKEGGKTIKIIHMSDLHFDLKYQEGALASCNKPLCCREESGRVR
jgi:sphingomyelin phosphodiesterase